jgi:hypothetical protein
MKLIDNWRAGYKMHSVRAMGLAAAVLLTYETLPPEFKATISPNMLHYVAIGLMVVGTIGRFLQQTEPTKPFPDTTIDAPK